MHKVTHYTINNRITGKVTTAKTRSGATRVADRMDNAYGAVCCTVKAHWSHEA